MATSSTTTNGRNLLLLRRRTAGGHAGVPGLAGGGCFGGVGDFALLTDHADEGLGGAREAAVTAVDEAEFAPEVHTFDGEQLHFAGFHIVLRKTLADDGDAGIGGDETLDHADAGQFHGDVNARAV